MTLIQTETIDGTAVRGLINKMYSGDGAFDEEDLARINGYIIIQIRNVYWDLFPYIEELFFLIKIMFTPTNGEVAKKGDEDKDDDDKEEKVEDEGATSTTMHRRDDKDDLTDGSWSDRPNLGMLERNQVVITGQIKRTMTVSHRLEMVRAWATNLIILSLNW